MINIKTIPVRTENSFVVTRDLLECTCLIDNELIESINCKNGKYFNEQAVWIVLKCIQLIIVLELPRQRAFKLKMNETFITSNDSENIRQH